MPFRTRERYRITLYRKDGVAYEQVDIKEQTASLANLDALYVLRVRGGVLSDGTVTAKMRSDNTLESVKAESTSKGPEAIAAVSKAIKDTSEAKTARGKVASDKEVAAESAIAADEDRKVDALDAEQAANLESARYANRNLLDSLLPKNLLEELRNFDLQGELEGFIQGNPLQFAELSARFVIAALRDIQDHIEMLVRGLDTLNDVAREITIATIVALRSLAKDALHRFSETLEKSNVDPTGITSTILGVAAAVLGFGASDGQADRDFRLQVTQSLNEITRNTQKTLDALADLQKSMEQHFADIAAHIDEAFYLDSLTKLQGSVDNATLLLDLPPAQLADPQNADRLRIQIDEIRTLIFAFARRYKAGVIGYCFQAYGIVVALMNAARCTNDEVATTRKEYGRGPFKTMLYADDGPIAQLTELQLVEQNEAEKFNALLAPKIIGVRTVQNDKVVFPPHNQGEPITIGLNEWHNMAYLFTLKGSVGEPAGVTYTVTELELATTPHEVGNVGTVKPLLDGYVIVDDMHFIVASANHVHTGSKEELDAAAKALGESAQKSAQKYYNSRLLQPDHEALITGVKAAFSV